MGNYQVQHTEIPENERRYESTIHLIDITHYDVGDFYCVNNDSFHDENLENLKIEFKLSGIYVYVNGKTLKIFPSFQFDMLT